MAAGLVTLTLEGVGSVQMWSSDGTVAGALTPVHLMDAAQLATLATAANQTALAGLVGEVAANPSANTIMDRLKALATALGTMSGYVSPSNSAVIITPGTPVPAGKRVFIACSAAGNVRLKFANASILDVPVNVGASMIDGVAVVDVVAANTTATAVVSVL